MVLLGTGTLRAIFRDGEQMMFQDRSWYQSVYIEHYWGTRNEHDTVKDSDEEEEESDGMDTD